jgi:DNA-binding NtrC family response regulator
MEGSLEYINAEIVKLGMSTSKRASVPAKKCVLVVEDEYFIAADLAREFRLCGMEVIGPIPDREEALKTISEPRKIDMAVLDINLQGEATFVVADALTLRGIPFVFATGYGESIVPEKYAKVPRWEKPFDCSALVRSIAKSR